MKKKGRSKRELIVKPGSGYSALLSGVVELLGQARYTCARSVNAVMTATYWEIGRRIVEFEQGGASKAEYGQQLLRRISDDLAARFGRGFGAVNLSHMRRFYLLWPVGQIFQTLSEKSLDSRDGLEIFQTPSKKSQTASRKSGVQKYATESRTPEFADIARRFPLPWSHYVKLLSVDNPAARAFYEAEALRGGWSVRQLDRQISTMFYEPTALSRNKAAMLRKSEQPKLGEPLTAEEELKDPLVLEFLGLKDEYSESDLEEGLIRHLEAFLLELGNDFAFIARQKRLRVGNEWYRIDLVFFHRRLRCLFIIDLKLGKFTHADAGQMNLYLNYAREHWTHPGENPPVGLILCAKADGAVAHYALGNLHNKVLAGEYRLALPDERVLVEELRRLDARSSE